MKWAFLANKYNTGFLGTLRPKTIDSIGVHISNNGLPDLNYVILQKQRLLLEIMEQS